MNDKIAGQNRQNATNKSLVRINFSEFYVQKMSSKYMIFISASLLFHGGNNMCRYTSPGIPAPQIKRYSLFCMHNPNLSDDLCILGIATVIAVAMWGGHSNRHSGNLGTYPSMLGVLSGFLAIIAGVFAILEIVGCKK